MHEYEIRILQASGSPAITTWEMQLTDFAAIRSARKMAHGEALRGLERPGVHYRSGGDA